MSSSLFQNSINTVTINGLNQPVGRYPNLTAPNGGYLTFEGHVGNTQITDNELTAGTNWSGAELVIRKERWVIDRNLITSHNGNTLTYNTGSAYHPINGYGYFIQNHVSALDQIGEWCYLSAQKKTKMFFGSGSPVNYEIKASYVNKLIDINTRSNIHITDLRLQGSQIGAVTLSNCQHIRISNMEMDFSGTDAITAVNSSYLEITGNSISHTNNDAIILNNCSGSTINENAISHTGMVPGAGKSGDDTYQGIIARGSNNIIRLNRIDSTGYIPIRFEGNTITIEKNFIDQFTIIKDDGGGIYTWKDRVDNSINYGRKVLNNIILNGKGAPQGTNSTDERAHGIYIDDNSQAVEILGNTVANCGENGIYIHNAKDLIIRSNNIYNNGKQARFCHDNIAPNSPIRNVIFEDNILFSKFPSQLTSNFTSTNNDFEQFGTFDSNFYCRPLDDNFIISTTVDNSTYSVANFNLPMWKSSILQDSNSLGTPIQILPYQINNMLTSNKFTNGAFNSNISGANGYSTNGNGGLSWTNSGGLTGGCLKVAYQTPPGTANHVIVNLLLTPVQAGKTYVVKFSMIGTTANRAIDVFLRKTLAPYSAISSDKFFVIKSFRTEQEVVFTCQSTESNPSLIFEIDQPNGTVWLDNIEMMEANVAFTNPDSHIRFDYNSTSQDITIPLSSAYINAKGTSYFNSITLPPFCSSILMKLPLTVLPVKFLNFSAVKLDTYSKLDWSVSNDGHAQHFEIERSENNVLFSMISTVPANAPGNNNPYSFLDLLPFAPESYYRIKEVDINGISSYSKTIRLHFSKDQVSIFPNPVNHFLSVCVAKNSPQNYTLNIYNLVGAKVKSTVLKNVNGIIKLDISTLNHGEYILEIISEESRYSETFLKQ